MKLKVLSPDSDTLERHYRYEEGLKTRPRELQSEIKQFYGRSERHMARNLLAVGSPD